MSKTTALICALVMATSGRAQADVTSSVYDDAKEIITDLITDELSRQVVPRLVCQARHDECGADACTGLDAFTVEVGGRHYLMTMLFHYRDSLQSVFSHRYSSLRSAIKRESEDYAAFQVYEILNSLLYPDAVRGAKQSDAKGAARVVVMANDDKVVESPNKSELRTPFEGELMDKCEELVLAKFESDVFTTARPAPLDVVCASTPENDNVKLAHNTLKCELSLAVRSALRQERDGVKGHVFNAAALVVQLAVKAQVPAAELASRTQRIALVLRELLLQQPMEPTLVFEKVKPFIEDVTGRAEASFTADDKLIYSAIEKLISAWRTFSGSEDKLDLATLLDQLLKFDGAFTTLCESSTIKGRPLCTALGKLHAKLGRATAYWPLIDAAAHADYRQVAHQVISLLFRELGNKECDTEKGTNFKNKYSSACRYVIYRRFADSLVSYFLDAGSDDGTAADGARAAFRTASVDVLRDIAALGGMDRGPSLGHIFMPDLELRAGYSESYGMGGSYSEVRTTAAIRVLTLRPILFYSTKHYLALHLSVFDALAPFAEIKKRPSSGMHYDSEGLWVNLLSPTAEIAYGMPRLSKHLVIGVSGTLRLATPVVTTGMDGSTSVTYETGWSKEHLELGAFVKYLL